VLQHGRIGETYNVGGGAERENLDLVRVLCAGIDTAFAASPELRSRFPLSPAARSEATASLITHVRDRPGHDRRYAIDGSKLERELGFVPGTTLDEGLSLTITWYLENEEWWRAVMDGRYRQWVSGQYRA
jgi:dTDP-glucose 4,6-dehydratase